MVLSLGSGGGCGAACLCDNSEPHTKLGDFYRPCTHRLSYLGPYVLTEKHFHELALTILSDQSQCQGQGNRGGAPNWERESYVLRDPTERGIMLSALPG